MIVRSNALRLPLRDGCVDLIVTSPPYFALRSYRDGGEHYDGQLGSEETPGAPFGVGLGHAPPKFTKMEPVVPTGPGVLVREMVRVLKPTTTGGPALCRSGGIPAKSLMGLPWRYANACVDRLGLILRRDLIWHKRNGLPESVTDRCHTSHEYWFHFVKQGQYFAAVDEIREPQKYPDDDRSKRNNGDRAQMANQINGAKIWGPPNPLGRVPGSVWAISSEPLIVPEAIQRHYDLPDHFAAFPQEWPRRLILGWCPAGGVVLDPFGGTGTVAMVARALGRIGLNGDLSGDYCRLARWRNLRIRPRRQVRGPHLARRTRSDAVSDVAGLVVVAAWCWLIWTVDQHLKNHRPHQ